MRTKTFQNWLLIVAAIALLFTSPMKAQVNIGKDSIPHAFSILELSTNNVKGGLRLTQLTSIQRDSIEGAWTGTPSADAAKGLVIFNITTKCLEFWNSKTWVSLCADAPKPPFSVTPASIWLSPSTGNSAKTVQVYSNNTWSIATPPANASLSATSGNAKTTDLLITRNDAVYGQYSFVAKDNVTGETVTVYVDNYFMKAEDDQFFLTNNNPTGNTGTYVIDVYGGSEKFTIVPGSYPNWITSATITSDGKLQLVADQSPLQEERDGYITLAHADDPSYQITIPIVQSSDQFPPFKYLVMKISWNLEGDVYNDADLAVEFTPSSPPNPSFVNYPHPTDGKGIKAVGYQLPNWIGKNGDMGGANWILATQDQVVDTTTLLIWGGDAKAGEGETVFLKAPLITPADSANDTQNLPRYITMDIYSTWWTGNQGSHVGPMKLSISTYDDQYNGVPSIMLKPGTDSTFNNPNIPPAGQERIYWSNFYNVPQGTTVAQIRGPNAWSLLNPPLFKVEKDLVVNTTNSNISICNGLDVAEMFWDPVCGYTRLATITYDRYKHTAAVTWWAETSTTPVFPSSAAPNSELMKANTVSIGHHDEK